MPVKHQWEIAIGDKPAMEVESKQKVIKLARSAQAIGQTFVIYENGVRSDLTEKFNGTAKDLFNDETRLKLHSVSFSISRLAQEFENGMSDVDLREEVGELLNALEDMYQKTDKRINEREEQETSKEVAQEVAQAI